jgi:hypothetical protein
MKYYEKLGLDFIKSNTPEETRESIVDTKNSKNLHEDERVKFLVSDTSFLLKYLYLLGRVDEAFYEIPTLKSVVLEYLMGNWQKTVPFNGKIDPNGHHRSLIWLDKLRSFLMWCSAIQDWKSITESLQFMDNEVHIDKCGVEGKNYYIALRHHFEGNKQERDSRLKTVIDGRNKKYRQQTETFQSILDGDADIATKKWNAVFKLWLQQDAKMDWYLAPEPTFLYYFAFENGISFPLQEDQKDHIINFEQQKGKH